MMKTNKFKIAFLILICYLIAQPLVSDKSTVLRAIFLYGLVGGYLFSPYLLSKNKKWLAFGVGAICIVLLLDIINYNNNVYFYSSNFFELTLHFIVIFYLFQHIISAEEITDDLVYASLLGYFLLAIGFAHAYGVLDELGYIEFKPEEMFSKNSWNYLYYSFSTLTTLGYGDVVPVSPLAKRLSGIEAATGVLYVAVFIGRLIGMHSIMSKNKQN
ncbi:two pore domain potassium channel family protein [bacterium]|nr:two pore domain potassium channel family protein [bacterium]